MGDTEPPAPEVPQTVGQRVTYDVPINDNVCDIICEYTPLSHVVDLRTVKYEVPPGTTNLMAYTEMVYKNIRLVSTPEADTRARTCMKLEDGTTVICEIKKKGAAPTKPSKKRKSDGESY
jgi:hypothetical protein